ncbi:Poly(3-hydroxybutyrate) depolymerase [Nannocystis exedens]|uniref:Poly(3-hydroxybutyrate) depolymerase n=1 Tax=Nannocystis exedens TaxID=54 RepID=A0A1I2G794_9BACT|nr:hypothetical protein [Nannocystis exedens]PCC67273.1 putative lipoprotein [Nannocystis exedens]SFF12870.1 Poly(3-hydroxybutyrate) depolymerase [Nannocystis exedens]
MRRRLALVVLPLFACSTAADDSALTDGSPTDVSGDMSSSTGPKDPTTGTTDIPTTTDEPLTTGTTTDEPPATSGPPAGPCGQPPPFTGVMAQTIEAAGVERDYDLVIPESYDPDTAYPLVFAWHGRGGNGELARLYFKVEEASAGQAIFVYPDGLPLPDMDNQTGWDLAGDGGDVALFDAILADVGARLCIDPARVFSTGHSFGGYMSNTLGCARGGTVRAIAPVAGGGPFGACTGQVAAWIVHGTGDTTVPLSQGEGARDHWLSTNSCGDTTTPVEPAPCVAYDDCASGFPVHWCQHDEPDLGGHGWPAWAGPAIWSFFTAL